MCQSIFPLIDTLSSSNHDGATSMLQYNFCTFGTKFLHGDRRTESLQLYHRRFILLSFYRSTCFHRFMIHYLWLIADCFLSFLYRKLRGCLINLTDMQVLYSPNICRLISLDPSGELFFDKRSILVSILVVVLRDFLFYNFHSITRHEMVFENLHIFKMKKFKCRPYIIIPNRHFCKLFLIILATTVRVNSHQRQILTLSLLFIYHSFCFDFPENRFHQLTEFSFLIYSLIFDSITVCLLIYRINHYHSLMLFLQIFDHVGGHVLLLKLQTK